MRIYRSVQVDQKIARRLSALLERRNRIEAKLRQIGDEIALLAWDACDQGTSRAEVARELGVGKTTMQGWVNRGRQLKGLK